MFKTYKSHKVVEAFEIGCVVGTNIYSKENPEFFVDVGAEFVLRHDLSVPGYLVRYEDGYMSVSPKAAFEKGNTEGGKRRIIHVVLGGAGFEPSIRDMQAVMSMFENAYLDPVGATVVTRHGIESKVELVEDLGDVVFVKVSIKEKPEKLKRKNWLRGKETP